MDISMVGIDYNTADVELRERFALTASRGLALAEVLVRRHGAEGCVVLSTCNRTEVWWQPTQPTECVSWRPDI